MNQEILRYTYEISLFCARVCLTIKHVGHFKNGICTWANLSSATTQLDPKYSVQNMTDIPQQKCPIVQLSGVFPA